MSLALTPGRRSVLQASGLVAASAAVLTACGSEGGAASPAEAPTDGVLRLGVLGDIGQPPDPDIYYSGNGLAITMNVYEGLVRYALGNHDAATVEPLLAESWEVNDDFTEYTFVLRQGVTFHDGTPFTAEAVGASFDRRLAVDAGPAYLVQGISSTEAVDDFTVTVTLEEPNSAFLDYLASPYGPRMLSPTVLSEQAGDDHAQSYLAVNDAGTGPYVLSKSVVGEGYQLTAYEDYWGDAPAAFTTIELPVYTEISAMELELQQGDLHALLVSVPTTSREGYMESDELTAYSMASFQVGVLYMNPNREVLADATSRVTLFEGIDWAGMVDQVVKYSAVPSAGNYPQGALPAELDDRPLVHDAAALEAWATSLPEGTAIQIGHNAGSTDSEQISNLIAAQLQGYGIAATVTAHQTSEVFGAFFEDPTSSPDVFVAYGTWPDSNNPYMHGHVFWDPDGGLNFLQCSDEEATELLAEALRTGDESTYAQAGAAAYAAGCAPVWSYATDFMVTQPWIEGVEEAHSIAAPATLYFARLSIAS